MHPTSLLYGKFNGQLASFHLGVLFIRQGISPVLALSRVLGGSRLSWEAQSQESECLVLVPAWQWLVWEPSA